MVNAVSLPPVGVASPPPPTSTPTESSRPTLRENPQMSLPSQKNLGGSTKQARSRRGLIIGGIILVVLLIGAGVAALLVQQSQDVRQQASTGVPIGQAPTTCQTDAEKAPITGPSVVTPAGGAQVSAATSTLQVSWNSVPGVTRYTFSVWPADKGGSCSDAGTYCNNTPITGTSASVPMSALIPNTLYNVTARAENPCTFMFGLPGPITSFTLGASAAATCTTPAAPTITQMTPTLGASTASFSWTPVAGVTQYKLVVWRPLVSTSCSDAQNSCTSISGTSASLGIPPLLYNGQYQWKVAAVNSCGTEGAFATGGAFTMPKAPTSTVVAAASPSPTPTATPRVTPTPTPTPTPAASTSPLGSLATPSPTPTPTASTTTTTTTAASPSPTPTSVATVTQPAEVQDQPVTGSTETTIGLLLGGIMFTFVGFLLARRPGKVINEN